MTQRNLYLAAYDISDPNRQADVRELIRAWAVGGQLSSYETYLTLAERAQMLAEIKRLQLTPEDRIALIRLDPRGKVYTLGRALPPPEGSYFYLG